MKQVQIVTDSTAQLDPDLAQELGITVVPMEISFGSQKFLEGVDLSPGEFFRRAARSSVMPSSAPPTVDDLRAVYAELGRSTDKILSIHVSGGLNDTCANADLAAEDFLGRCEIIVIDSWTISVGLSILAQAAARAALRGEALDEIVRLMRGMIAHIYAVFVAENLEYMERARHFSQSQAILGTMLDVKPFLAIEEGEIAPMEKVRTRGKAVDKLVDFVSEFSRVQQIAVLQSPSRTAKEAQLLFERLQSNFPDYAYECVTYGPTLGTHIGPDGLGLIVYEGLK